MDNSGVEGERNFFFDAGNSILERLTVMIYNAQQISHSAYILHCSTHRDRGLTHREWLSTSIVCTVHLSASYIAAKIAIRNEKQTPQSHSTLQFEPNAANRRSRISEEMGAVRNEICF